MKKGIFIFFVIITSLDCNDNNLKPQGCWIEIYSVLHRTSHTTGDGNPALIKKHNGYILDTMKLNKVLTFVKDTMTLTNFNETFYQGYTKNKFNFDLTKDSIFIDFKEEKNPIKYSYKSKNCLILYFEGTSDSKFENHFILVEDFEMANKQKEISNFLTNNPIILHEKKDKIELNSPNWHHMGEFIQDSLEVNYGSGMDWYFYSERKELFLVIADKLIHINDFDNQKLYGFTYDRKKSEFIITKSNYSQNFNTDFLLGKWIGSEELLNKNNVKKSLKIEIITDNIIVSTKNSSDTLQWKLNKYRNKLLIENSDDTYEKYWKIESLSKTQLVIKRKINNYDPKIEIIHFTKE